MLVKAYGAHAGEKPLEPMQINRREPAAHDVQIDIAFCGICHSDLHQVRAEWAGTQFPCVPGHEIVGHVSAVGAHVADFKVGDLVGEPFACLRELHEKLEVTLVGAVLLA